MGSIGFMFERAQRTSKILFLTTSCHENMKFISQSYLCISGVDKLQQLRTFDVQKIQMANDFWQKSGVSYEKYTIWFQGNGIWSIWICKDIWICNNMCICNDIDFTTVLVPSKIPLSIKQLDNVLDRSQTTRASCLIVLV